MTPSDPSAVWMGVLFLLAGVGCLAFMRRRAALAQSSRRWPTAPATVVASRVRYYRSGDGMSSKMYYPAIAYQYEVGGRRYRSKRIYFDQVASVRSRAAGIVAKYPPGATVPVYYDPSNPARAVLEPGMSGAYNYGLFGCAFFLLGLFFIVYLGFLR